MVSFAVPIDDSPSRRYISVTPLHRPMSGAISWPMPQRTFKGTCVLYGTSVGKRRSALHDGTCAAAHDAGQSRPTALLTFRVAAARAPEYWLDIEADAAAALSKLDAFLRDI